MKEEQIGVVGVDTGRIMVIDPIHVEKYLLSKFDGGITQMCHFIMVTNTPSGDGVFPIITRSENGITKEIVIKFNEDSK
jgi:hypothetical protein